MNEDTKKKVSRAIYEKNGQLYWMGVDDAEDRNSLECNKENPYKYITWAKRVKDSQRICPKNKQKIVMYAGSNGFQYAVYRDASVRKLTPEEYNALLIA